MISNRPPLERLRENMDRAGPGSGSGPDDPGQVEAVHQLRVACARLDTWLLMAEQADPRKRLRRLRRAAGEARNLHITLERDLPPRFRAWLEQRQPKAQAHLHRRLADPRTAALLSEIEALPPLSEEQARAGRAALAGRALERLPEGLHALADWHRLRRTLRRVRYATEWLGEDASALKSAHEALGVHSDALALADWLELYPGGARRLRALVKVQLRQGVDAALQKELATLLESLR